PLLPRPPTTPPFPYTTLFRSTENSIVRRAQLFSWALHPNALKAIQLFYEGARAYVQRRFPKIYRDTGGQSVGKQILHDWEDTILDRKSTRLNSSHVKISYAVF